MIQQEININYEDGTQTNCFDPCPPFSECWCEEHPQACDKAEPPSMSINTGLNWLILIGLVYFCIKLNKWKYSSKEFGKKKATPEVSAL